MSALGRWGARLPAALMLLLLLVPVLGLLLGTSVEQLTAGLAAPATAAALWLSLRTTLVSLGIILALGTALAWQLSRTRGRWGRLLGLVVELPVVIPPAVVGVALLLTFGRQGLLGGALAAGGVQLPFSTAAVVLAQVVVAGPFFVQAATAAFRRVDPELMLVARTLGATPAAAFRSVALPAALPGLLAGAALAWARALGEFGATLIFAGNLPGHTQTLPLAIFGALERDVGAASAVALVLLALAVGLLGLLRLLPARWQEQP